MRIMKRGTERGKKIDWIRDVDKSSTDPVRKERVNAVDRNFPTYQTLQRLLGAGYQSKPNSHFSHATLLIVCQAPLCFWCFYAGCSDEKRVTSCFIHDATSKVAGLLKLGPRSYLTASQREKEGDGKDNAYLIVAGARRVDAR